MHKLVLLACAIASLGTFAAALAATPSPADCYAVPGMHVTLFGGVDDPDVLVWDSRARLVRFSAGSTDTRKFLLPHAMLNRPGTRAIVQACVDDAVHSKFRTNADDAVGVLIVSGRYHGRYGWVSSSDIHGKGIPEAQDPW